MDHPPHPVFVCVCVCVCLGTLAWACLCSEAPGQCVFLAGLPPGCAWIKWTIPGPAVTTHTHGPLLHPLCQLGTLTAHSVCMFVCGNVNYSLGLWLTPKLGLESSALFPHGEKKNKVRRRKKNEWRGQIRVLYYAELDYFSSFFLQRDKLRRFLDRAQRTQSMKETR